MARNMISAAWAGLSVLFAVSPVAAQDETGDWRYVGRDEAFAYGWDFASAEREGGIARAKIMRSELPLELDPKGIPASIIVPDEPVIDFDYAVAVIAFDCSRDQFTVERYSMYALSGETLSTEAVQEAPSPLGGPTRVVAPLACNGHPRLQPQPPVSTPGFALNVREMAE